MSTSAAGRPPATPLPVRARTTDGGYGRATARERSQLVTFGEAISTVLSKYITFDGRARRSEYWYWFLAIVLVEIVVGIFYLMSSTLGILLYVVFGLAIILPSIAVAIRRLHDTNRTGWWILLTLIPFGGLVLLVFYVLEGTPGDNQYGPSPKAVQGPPLSA